MKKDMMSDVKDKLKAELADAKKKGRYAAAILDGSLGKCGEAIEKGCQGKKAVSDLDVYRMAV